MHKVSGDLDAIDRMRAVYRENTRLAERSFKAMYESLKTLREADPPPNAAPRR